MFVEIATRADEARVLALDAREDRAATVRAAIERGTCLVARDGERIVGFAIAERSFFEQMFIALLVVNVSDRRRGVATALMRHVESATHDKLFTSTNRSNAAMRALCVAVGFVESGIIENLDDGDPEIIYFKRL